MKNSQLVTISFSSARPDLAAQAANALTELYIQQTLDFRYRISAEAGVWLDGETKEQAQKVQAAEVALQKFGEEQGLANVEERRTLLDQKLKDLGSSLTVGRRRGGSTRRRSTGRCRPRRTRRSCPKCSRARWCRACAPSSRRSSGRRRSSRRRVISTSTPRWSRCGSRRGARDRRSRSRRAASCGAAQNDYRVAAAQEAVRRGGAGGGQDEAQDLSRRGLEYDALKRDLEASKQVAASILARQKQTDVSRDVQASNVHVIDPAIVPETPGDASSRARPRPHLASRSRPAPSRAAFLRDYLDTSVGRPSDVRRLGVPLLGRDPRDGRRARALLLLSERSTQGSLSPRAIASCAPLFARRAATDGGQVLLVTSTLAGEGKSLTSVNLALALASAESSGCW